MSLLPAGTAGIPAAVDAVIDTVDAFIDKVEWWCYFWCWFTDEIDNNAMIPLDSWQNIIFKCAFSLVFNSFRSHYRVKLSIQFIWR